MVALKEQLMQERNDARREKARLDNETVRRVSIPARHALCSLGDDIEAAQ